MAENQQIHKADGVTGAERRLKILCERTFLSLWSYPSVYRDQGKQSIGREGKEVCDLLVVFENHVIIFSDKDCEFPNTGNPKLDWCRWFRRAVEDSAKQIWGAERWIKQHNDRLFLDRNCTQPFPIGIPKSNNLTFHRVVVAHAASAKCKQVFCGSGSLMFDSQIVGDQHTSDTCEPFVIGHINPDKGFTHVFDDTSLSIVMDALDTITDFVEYLSKKEAFYCGQRAVRIAGEEEFLALYLRNMDEEGNHNLVIQPDINAVTILEGHWDEFTSDSRRKAQFAANRVSYVWDGLIEITSKHVMQRTQYYTSSPLFSDSEKNLRFLAREPRTRRRMLGRNLLDFFINTPAETKRARVIMPSNNGDPYYVFLALPHLKGIAYHEYREVRRKLLTVYCMVVKYKYPQAEDIVGIATESGRKEDGGGSEDIISLDARCWTDEEEAEAKSLQTDLDIFNNVDEFVGSEWEYPQRGSDGNWSPGRWASRRKLNRNWPCPCGSKVKYKRCCEPKHNMNFGITKQQ